jgi:hypothetical protein
MVLSIPSASMIRAATSVRQVWTRGLGNYDRQFFQFVLLRTVSITVATSIFAAHQALGEVADVLAGIGVTAARAPNSACLHQLSSSGRICRQPTEAWAHQGAEVPCFAKIRVGRSVGIRLIAPTRCNDRNPVVASQREAAARRQLRRVGPFATRMVAIHAQCVLFRQSTKYESTTNDWIHEPRRCRCEASLLAPSAPPNASLLANYCLVT